ncbi:MAG: hypothetical protein HY855_26685 [Burkholderiales bacterium]|nr:hypothetical protein [Burkholderiales bacterium]
MSPTQTLIAALTLAFSTLAAQAQTPTAASTPRADQREANQQARIAQGAASGALTPRETRRLERQQAAINRAEAQAKSDGTVTKQERHRLHHMQDNASRDIYRQKHDRQRAASAPSR